MSDDKKRFKQLYAQWMNCLAQFLMSTALSAAQSLRFLSSSESEHLVWSTSVTLLTRSSSIPASRAVCFIFSNYSMEMDDSRAEKRSSVTSMIGDSFLQVNSMRYS